MMMVLVLHFVMLWVKLEIIQYRFYEYFSLVSCTMHGNEYVCARYAMLTEHK